MRAKKPKDWLLLLIRTLLVLFIVLMFLRPLFFAQQRLAGNERRKNVVLIVDATASMACVDGAQTRFAAACAEAAEVLAGLDSEDTANVIWLDSDPQSEFPAMGSNIGYLRDRLRQARVAYEAGNVAAAFNMAIEMISPTEGKQEICLISDFQSSVWAKAAPPLPQGVELVYIKVGDSQLANGAIADIVCKPPKPLMGEKTTVFCTVHNYSAEPRRRTVFFEAGEIRGNRTLLIPAWGQATASFDCSFNKPGQYPLRAHLDEDLFAGDDQRVELIEVDANIAAAVVGDDPAATVWMRVLNAIGWVDVRQIDADSLKDAESSFDLLVLSGWQGGGAETVAAMLAEGATVFCAPAPGLSASHLTKLAPTMNPQEDARFLAANLSQPAGVRIVEKDDRAFEIFAEGEYGDPLASRFAFRLDLPAAVAKAGRVLAAYEDGMPALSQLTERQNLFLWNLTLDPDYSAWSAQAEFLPFVAELMLAARINSADPQRAQLEPGQRAVLQLRREVPVAEVDLQGPDGDAVPINANHHGGGFAIVSEPLQDLGLFVWRHSSKTVEMDAVNFPAIESDLRSMSIGELKEGDAVAVSRGEQVRRLRDGIKLWPALLGLAFVLILAEMAVIHWAEKK